MKKTILVLGLVVLFIGIQALRGFGQGRPPVPKKPNDKAGQGLDELMRRKLQNAQKVLDGIATNDFDKISKHADELIFISKQAGWKTIHTPRYELYSNDFRRIAATMVQEAKQKNLEGAALAYVEMTLSCVKCHKYVRETRQARLGQLEGLETSR